MPPPPNPPVSQMSTLYLNGSSFANGDTNPFQNANVSGNSTLAYSISGNQISFPGISSGQLLISYSVQEITGFMQNYICTIGAVSGCSMNSTPYNPLGAIPGPSYLGGAAVATVSSTPTVSVSFNTSGNISTAVWALYVVWIPGTF